MKLTKQLLQKWVKALRSGKYKQGEGELRNNNHFCCLGVLCDISKAGRWLEDPDNFGSFTYIVGKGKEYGMDLRNEYNKDEPCLFNMDNGFMNTLTAMNDVRKRSFSQIAYEIERHFHINGR